MHDIYSFRYICVRVALKICLLNSHLSFNETYLNNTFYFILLKGLSTLGGRPSITVPHNNKLLPTVSNMYISVYMLISVYILTFVLHSYTLGLLLLFFSLLY